MNYFTVEKNSGTGMWEVVDQEGFCFVEFDTREEAIETAKLFELDKMNEEKSHG